MVKRQPGATRDQHRVMKSMRKQACDVSQSPPARLSPGVLQKDLVIWWVYGSLYWPRSDHVRRSSLLLGAPTSLFAAPTGPLALDHRNHDHQVPLFLLYFRSNCAYPPLTSNIFARLAHNSRSSQANVTMDRDRDRDRRDERYSNTYRPRSPGPRIDSYRSNRSPPRRGLPAADTYTPGRSARPRSRSPFRRRSRSPRRERDDDRWTARPRSPPRREFSPRRDDFRGTRGRSPRRGEYDSYTRSPRRRDRSRDLSPARSRGMRSPPRGRYDESRSRAHSPYRRYSPPRDTRDFRRRSPSPRRDRAEVFTADTWRRRSPSPRAAYTSNDASGRESGATSRRSSPPVHPSRAAYVPDDRPMRDRDAMSAPRSPHREREERDRDYDRDRDYGRERERERERSPPRHRDTPPTGPRSEREFAPPSGPSASYRNGDGNNFVRAPPTGPSGGRGYPSPAISPPAGPSTNTSQPPAYPRGGSNPVLSAPTRPRGGGRGGFGYDAPRDFSGGPPPRRGSWSGAGGRGGYFGGAPPAGPRGPPSGSAAFAPPFRGSSNSTSTTYPRTQRFQNHLADLPKEIPGGQKAPDPYDRSKIMKLEEEAKKLREQIEAKESAKRQRLHEWDNLEREANNVSLKADLAEQQLRSLNGDGEMGGAAF
ncbi:hypothetical protein EJ04DRAFT_256051 [Polyplosphaeria fusca]|uniref:Uncharacterized protein n=1 Tax=Polyplosphaeria fusca TaxID=682080 RepID=A0A9P4QZH6_9PLEO|nr:hypothetical protein EJ04DRAFT_256051 [Polyplosphaeria fusca]